MRNLFALTRRELGVYFVSPIAYIILTGFLAVSGMMFYQLMLGYAKQSVPATLGETIIWLINLLMFVTPLITMRLIAEEKSRGTIETMMTSPVAEWQFVLSKYAAAMLFTAYLLLPTLFYAAFVAAFSTLDIPATIVGYSGLMLTIGAVLAIGLFISAVSSTQITAGVVTLVVTIGLLLASGFSSTMKGSSFWIITARETLNRIGLLDYAEEFAAGKLNSSSLVYLVSVIGFFLFLTVRVVESRRWR